MSRAAAESVQPAEGGFRLALSAQDGNLAITALAERPFKEVYELIGKLNRQANAGAPAPDGRQTYALDGPELKLIVGALGNLPYQQVHALVHELQRQVQAQASKKDRKKSGPDAGRKR